MSSVGSSDGSNRNDEIVRRQREDAKKAEAEAAKRHKKELRSLNENHFKEVERLKQTHAEQLNNLREHSNDTISERDHKYQQEMDEMREIHKKSLKQNASEMQRREETLRNSIGADAENTAKRQELRMNKLNKDYHGELTKKDKQFESNIREAREAQMRAVEQNREKLSNAHKREEQALRAEREATVTDLETRFAEYRKNSGERLRDQEIKHMQDQHRSSENLMRTVNRERNLRTDSESNLREGFQDGLETMKERYNREMKKNQEDKMSSQAHMNSSVRDRINGQLRRLEHENAELKDTNVRKEMALKQEKQRDISHIREAWGKNLEQYKEQRDEAIRMSNERSAADVSKVRDEMNQNLTASERFYRGKMEENNRINRNAYDALVGDFESRQEQTQSMANQRVNHIYTTTAEEKARLSEHQVDLHAATQRQKQDEIKALRDVMESDKNQVVNRLQDQIRKQEVQHAEKMNVVVQKYEKQLQTLKDEMMRERKLSAENLKRTVDELQRAHKISLDQVEAKNRDRMRTVTSQQQEEIRAVNKRHEEKLDAVLTEVKKT